MDLILWRHAQAEDAAPHGSDLARALTKRGEQQAAKVARWLAQNLPRDTRILCSPARRCQQTVEPLEREWDTVEDLAPGNGPERLLLAAGWPSAEHPVLLVGHQPVLGATVARLMAIASGECRVRKGAVWWLRSEQHAGALQASIVAVQGPELL
jgi:phosphohistidine phosphatase